MCARMRVTCYGADRADWHPQTTKMGNLLARLWNEETGQDLVEYAMVAALIALASVASLNSVANLLKTAFANAVANMSSTTT